MDKCKWELVEDFSLTVSKFYETECGFKSIVLYEECPYCGKEIEEIKDL